MSASFQSSKSVQSSSSGKTKAAIEVQLHRNNTIFVLSEQSNKDPELFTNKLITKLKRILKGSNFNMYSFDTTAPFKNPNRVDDEVVDQINKSSIVVACITKELRHSLSCKMILQFVRDLKLNDFMYEKSNLCPEVSFCLMQGDYTMVSQPYAIDGWLRHLMRDTVNYPSWNMNHIDGTAESIANVISLQKRLLVVPPTPEKDVWEKRMVDYKKKNPSLPPPVQKHKSPVVVLYEKLERKKKMPIVDTRKPLDHRLAFR